MTQLVISDEMRDRLLLANGPVDLVDARGRVVGRAEASGRAAGPVHWESLAAEMGLSVEEAKRRFDGTGPRFTTAEVLAHARQRAGQ